MDEMQKILIVEDEAISAEGLQSALIKMGFEVVGIAANALDALDLVAQDRPDIAILDINIQGSKDGIWLAKQMNLQEIPFIFLTAYGDTSTIKEAIETNPGAYLIKPFTRPDIFAAIELTNKKKEKIQPSGEKEDHLFIKDDNAFVKLNFDEVLYIKSSGNYVEIQTKEHRHLIRETIKNMKLKLPNQGFHQVHRSYLVNLGMVDKVGSNYVMILDEKLPLGASYREQLMKILNIN